jgi:anthranilate phosphoribosyltransferase
VVRSVLAGGDGAARDVVLLNAGAAIYVGGAAEDLSAGVEKARAALDSGAAAEILERLVGLTGELAG